MALIKSVNLVQRGNKYQLDYYNHDGLRVRISAGGDYNTAQRIKIKFDQWLLEGKDPVVELDEEKRRNKASSITVNELYEIFRERHMPKLSMTTQEKYTERLETDITVSRIHRHSDIESCQEYGI